MMFRDASELRQPLAKKAVSVFAVVDVSITDHELIGVGDGQVAVHPLQLLDSIVDIVAICTQNYAPVTVFCNHFIGVLEILTDQKLDPTIIPTKECQDWWFV